MSTSKANHPNIHSKPKQHKNKANSPIKQKRQSVYISNFLQNASEGTILKTRLVKQIDKRGLHLSLPREGHGAAGAPVPQLSRPAEARHAELRKRTHSSSALHIVLWGKLLCRPRIRVLVCYVYPPHLCLPHLWWWNKVISNLYIFHWNTSYSQQNWWKMGNGWVPVVLFHSFNLLKRNTRAWANLYYRVNSES